MVFFYMRCFKAFAFIPKIVTFESLESNAMRALSIKTRLFIYSMLFSFVGLVLVGAFSYYSARKIGRAHV